MFSSLSVSSHTLVTHTKVYILAQNYNIDALKAAASLKCSNLVEHVWNSSSFVDSLSMRYEPSSGLPESDALREIVVAVAGKHAKSLLERKDFLELLRKRGDIATDILRASLV